MIALAGAFSFPLAFMLADSLKTEPRFTRAAAENNHPVSVISTPGMWGFGNYEVVLGSPQFLRFFANSLLIAGTTVGGGLLVNSLLAYSLARRRWKGSRLALGLIMTLMIAPFNAISMPLLLIVNWFGWLDTYQVQIVPFLATPLYVFLFYQFFIGIPRDYSDQAAVDGANPLQIYWHVILPLSGPVLANVTVLNFLVAWGAYLWPLITVRSPDYYPLMIGVAYMSQVGQGAAPTAAMAFFALTSLPVLGLFLIFQKQFMQSAIASSVMG
ncbi:MAG TPA: carbohydrate ABC transporter permease [Aggregatilineaceae bacterium]|nr:carbohydrate ABC transporter permease [Aggregatilineaceae bacterium]